METKSADLSIVSGMIGNDKLICQYVRKVTKRGIWLGDNPFNHITSIITVQIVFMFIIGRISYFLLKPCHQTLLIAQIVAGIILGPLLLGTKDSYYELIFPTASRLTLTTFAEFGMIIHFFKVGVQINPMQHLKIEKQAVVTGLIGHMSAMALGTSVFNIVRVMQPLAIDDPGTYALVVISSVSAFPVICGFLTEMNILNSEIGRMALSTSIVSEASQVAGQPSFLVAFWFGLVLPDGPPLGSVLAQRLDTIGSTLIVPAFCTISGLRTSVPSLSKSKSSVAVIFISVFIGKFVGTLLPSLHFRMEFWDSFALALIMCCKGLVDISLLNILLNSKAIGELSFTLAIYIMVAVTGFATLVVYYIYDPSRRYRAYIRKSIRDSQQDLDLKILVCIHNEENVYPIINLLQASNPTEATPLSIFALHLMELSGRATSVLTKTENTNKSSQHIYNVFDQFEQHNKGCITLQCFTAIAPYASMHDDICYIAMDTKSNIVIMPFHKQWSIDGNVEFSNSSIRTLNQKVLKKAPCSVGILIDRSQLSGKLLVIYEKLFCEVAMVFLGGGDDQEALAYSLRMAQHPHVKLTVFWIRVKMQVNQRNVRNTYIDLMEYMHYHTSNKGKVTFKEEIVDDGAGTAQVIRTMEGHYSMVIVGRHHMADNPCTLGLTEWCELPELGPLGNLLATSDFTFSVLVVQQQPPFSYELRYIR
ncbi:cation/H(+) antiporter 14-like [Abrus precatorius]|uniref:Cation/H(+) antiporter 14-like n=1 Tax=Abrus precatorius TaxID=3816 RepID=A0A8B8K198_ABRPR|nr:cation/H(+) antiporter 14-like [Abrus precatorius]